MFEFSWPWTIVWVIAAYVALSFRLLGPDQNAAVYILGKKWREVGPGGLIFVPLLLAQAKIFVTTAVQLQLPAEEEDIQKADQDRPTEGKKVPIRTTQASIQTAIYWRENTTSGKWEPRFFTELPDDEQKRALNDPLGDRLTTEPVVIIRWHLRRKPPKTNLFDFVANIGSVDEANKQIADTVVAGMRADFANTTAAHALSNMNFYGERIREKVEILIGEKEDTMHPDKEKRPPWGIDLLDVQVKDIDPGETVNKSFSEAAAALNKIKEQERLAEGRKRAKILDGQGDAAAARSMAEVLSTPEGQIAAQINAGVRIADNAQFMILPDAYGVVGGIAKAFDRVRGAPNTTAPETKPPEDKGKEKPTK